MELSLSVLSSQLYYDPTVKRLRWKVAKGPRKAGDLAGCRSLDGYLQITLCGEPSYAHRLIWMLFNKVHIPPGFQIDHIDHNRHNDAPENLRLVQPVHNARNQTRRKGVLFTGVSWLPRLNRWLAKISVDGKTKHLGLFKDFDEACRARKTANKMYGFHPNHGKVIPSRIAAQRSS
jgi:hypothetical protein